MDEMEEDEDGTSKELLVSEKKVDDEVHRLWSEETLNALDDTIGSLSKLELFLLIHQYDLLPDTYKKRTVKELSMDDFFVQLVSEDKLGSKHITCKDVVAERAKNTETVAGVYENVRCVNERFIQNKLAKVQQVLLKLGEKVDMTELEDVKGYCLDKWNTYSE